MRTHKFKEGDFVRFEWERTPSYVSLEGRERFNMHNGHRGTVVGVGDYSIDVYFWDLDAVGTGFVPEAFRLVEASDV